MRDMQEVAVLNCKSKCTLNGKERAVTAADEIRIVAVAVDLIPNHSIETCKLATLRKSCLLIPDVTLDVLRFVIVWKVVAVRLNEFLRARVVELAAKLADCNTRKSLHLTHGCKYHHHIRLFMDVKRSYTIQWQVKMLKSNTITS